MRSALKFKKEGSEKHRIREGLSASMTDAAPRVLPMLRKTDGPRTQVVHYTAANLSGTSLFCNSAQRPVSDSHIHQHSHPAIITF